MGVLENLTNIREITEKILPSGFFIVDVVYRDIDCGIFGGKGYTLVVKSSDNSVRGNNWDKIPTEKNIGRWVRLRIDAVESSATFV